MSKYTRSRFFFDIICLTIAAICVSSFIAIECFSQESNDSDKFKFNRKDYVSKPYFGYDAVSSLLDKAIAEAADESVISKLRVDKAIMVASCFDLKDRWRLMYESVEPVLLDPSPLLKDMESAKFYTEAVFIRFESIPHLDENESQVEIVNRAISEIETAMALTDRERFVLKGDLQSLGSHFAYDHDDFEGAINWVKPLLDEQKWLAEDSYGAERLNHVVRYQSKFLAKVGRLDEGTQVVLEAIATLRASPGLDEPRKLSVVGYLLASNLWNYVDNPTAPGAEETCKALEQQRNEMEQYGGHDLLNVQLTILEMDRAMIAFLGKRDLGRSMTTVDRMLSHFEKHDEVAKSKTAYHNANNYATGVLELLRDAKHPQEKELLQTVIEFQQKYEPTPSKEPGRVK